MTFRIGVDVGGTFTDFILADSEGGIELLKVPTTLDDQSRGVMNGIEVLAARRGLDARSFLGRTDLFVHGTTTADNTMIEMNGARTGLLTTQGHRDEIDIRRGYKESIWDPSLPPPTPIARRRHRFGIPERLDFRGQVVTPLDEEAVRDAVRRLRRQGIESIAVCFLFSFLNPAHELRVREIVREEYPGARISLSHEVMPTAPEFERTSTTLVDAYVGPKLSRYLERLERALREAGFDRELLIMQSNGGIMTAEQLARRAVAALGSGPTGGVIGACAVAARSGVKDFIAIDMGGTSYEACLVRDGAPTIRSFWNWQHRYLVGLPMVEMHSIGAGGGSIAIVQAGALRVGPESAKADPGPICYGRGGTRPTVTDANLVLGYINPEALCGGEFKLTQAGVREAILEQVGRPLGLDLVQAAHGIFRIVNANMTNAIRRVSSEAGHDPRAFHMVVYGGNGPIHAPFQAEELGIRKLLVPKTSPAFSALGLLIADFVVDRQRSYISPSSRASAERVNEIFELLEGEAEAELSAAGLSRGDLEFRRFVNLCYPGQTFDMAVPARTRAGRMSAADLAATIAAFHDLHEELHAYAARDEEPVVRSVRVQTLGRTAALDLGESARADAPLDRALLARRPAFFDGRFVDTPVYDGDRIRVGHEIRGPAIVEERFTTILVPPGWRAALDRFSNYEITHE
ncbi:MAG TPA: hydantoinase/oxoprolinase family protein [Myxococcota bacterium]|nr:hydantoinase/oxoprolinase family protein [Myxococcota bacterium]